MGLSLFDFDFYGWLGCFVLFETRSRYIAQAGPEQCLPRAGLELAVILLLQPPKRWDCNGKQKHRRDIQDLEAALFT